MKYNLLLFDADDTLFDYDQAEEAALKLSFSEHNISFEKSIHLPLYRRINKNIWNDLEKKMITPSELKAERFKRLFAEIGVDSVMPAIFSDTYLTFLSEQTFLLPDVIDVLEVLHEKTLMAIITNGLKEVQRPRISSSPISHFFRKYIISDEIGLVKPDKKFFDFALNELNHSNREQTLIIGDNLTSDIQGGINSGIDTCWFNWKKKQNDRNIKPNYEITKLKDLLNIIH